MSSRMPALLGFAVLVSSLYGCARRQVDEREDVVPVAVGVTPVVLSDFTVCGEYYGTAEPVVEARLIAQAGGRVDALSAEEGDQVRAEQSLGRIDAGEAIAAFERAEIAESVALETWQVRRNQQQRGAVSAVTVKQARLAYLDARNSRLQAGKVRDGALCITPIAGLVVLRFVDLYDELAPGAPTFLVAQLDTIVVRVGIPEGDIGELREGNAAWVVFDAVPGERFAGEVTRVGRALSPSTRTYPVYVRLENRNGRILAGLKARVDLVLRIMKDQVVVAADAIITEVDRHYVMIAVDGVARRREVFIGPSDEVHTVVTEGLEPGTTLIVSGQDRVRSGTSIRIEERQ